MLEQTEFTGWQPASPLKRLPRLVALCRSKEAERTHGRHWAIHGGPAALTPRGKAMLLPHSRLHASRRKILDNCDRAKQGHTWILLSLTLSQI